MLTSLCACIERRAEVEMDAKSSPVPRSSAVALSVLVALAIVSLGILHNPLERYGFMPHGHCYLWNQSLVWLHVTSDALIGISYVAISVTLAYLVYRARQDVPFGWMLLAFGLFIIACGMTHFMEVWTLWTPVYWLAGDVKLVTAAASVTTAVALPPLVPRALDLIAAAKRTEENRRLVERTNRELSAQIAERERAEAELRAARIDLERRVEERTAELARLAEENGRLYEAERAARNEAETANRVKDEFLATLSHELRTPLTPILAWVRMLNLGGLDETGVKNALASIERNARSQAQLVEDLLDVSRIVSGKLRLDVRPTELAPVVDAALEAIRPAADAKGIRLNAVLDPRSGIVGGDPERLQQIAWNLLSNAVKFTPRDGRVQVQLACVNSHVELTVSDTGCGIAPEFLPHVFERFRQADASASRVHGGLGLGLSIVRHLVEEHGGSVAVDSEGVGKGATFTVRLPLMIAPRHGREPRVHPAAAPVTLDSDRVPSLAGLRVLVVDDEPDTVEALRSILMQCDADVRGTCSADEALAVLGEWLPHVIISDIGMPGQDGYALIRAVRSASDERIRRVPAVALTAYARIEDRLRVLSAGFQMHVPKPVEPLELITIVANVAEQQGVRPL
jgi:signal transduction histidine kinase/ActR/RegA family two-component response regulator